MACAVQAARRPIAAQADQESPVLAIGALAAGLLAGVTLLRRRKPEQLEPLLKHVTVSAAPEAGAVTCHHLQKNLAPHRHGEVLAVRSQLLLLGFTMIIRCQHEGSSIAKRTFRTVAVDPVHVISIGKPGLAAEEEGEGFVGAVVVAEPHLAEADDTVADSGALVWHEHVAVHQDDGASLVEDVLDGVVVAAELDDWGSGRPLVLAGDLQAGVAAGVVSAVIGAFSGHVKGVVDIDAAAHRVRAIVCVIGGGLGLSRVAMGSGDMDAEVDEEEEEGEAW